MSFTSLSFILFFSFSLFLMQDRLQFFIVVYDFFRPNGRDGKLAAIDRFLIDLKLGPVPNSIPRQTYYGIYNIAQFDLSFNTSCECTNSSYNGSQCDFDIEEEYSCDTMGNMFCSNQFCDLATDCQECTTLMAATTSPTVTHNTPGTK